MVPVAQLAERLVVVQVVRDSSSLGHPLRKQILKGDMLMEITEEYRLREQMKWWCKEHQCQDGHGPVRKVCPVYDVCVANWNEATLEQLRAGVDAIDKALKIGKYKEE